MAKKKTENIKTAPVLRSGGESKTKTYQIMDPWKDMDVINLVDIKSVDGEITEVKVNGEPAGGGGGGMFSTAVLTATAPSRAVSVPYVILEENYSTIGSDLMTESNQSYNIVLVNGMCLMQTEAPVTGSAEIFDPDENIYKVTGNVTIS